MTKTLPPLAAKIVDFAKENGGSISAREAFLDLDITSASFTRRLTSIENAGYSIRRERKTHPVTGKKYTRYHIGRKSQLRSAA